MHVTCYGPTQYFQNFLEISCSLVFFFRDCRKFYSTSVLMAYLSNSRFAFHSSLSWTFSIFAVFRSIHILQLSICEGILHNNLRRYLLLMFYFFPVSLEFLGQHFCMSVHKANLTFIPLLTLKKKMPLKPCFISAVSLKPQTL